MTPRAERSGIHLDEAQAALVKGMIKRGDRQHDIAAWFGVNGGRIGEISTGAKFTEVAAAPEEMLPPPGPYMSGRDAHATIKSLETIQHILEKATRECKDTLREFRCEDT